MQNRVQLLLPILFFLPLCIYSQLRYSPSEYVEYSKRAPVYAGHGIVATSQPLVSQIALHVLKDGGNAIDAAIAANAAIGLMEPTGSGIGGDLFALVWSAKDNKLYGLNASGRASFNVTREKLVAEGLEEMPRDGVHVVTVPGAVDGWFMLHQKLGSIEMSELLAPAIAYAEEGFPLSPMVGWLMPRTLKYYRGEGYPHLEDGFDAGVKRQLYLKRHKLQGNFFYGGYQGILWDAEEGVYIGASESRSDGLAIGY